MTQEERIARMNQIKDELTALEDVLCCGSEADKIIALEKAGALQLEGRRLGDEFRAVRQAQQEAVAAAERLLDERSRNLPESDR